jgi:hypothetical protein
MQLPVSSPLGGMTVSPPHSVAIQDIDFWNAAYQAID